MTRFFEIPRSVRRRIVIAVSCVVLVVIAAAAVWAAVDGSDPGVESGPGGTTEASSAAASATPDPGGSAVATAQAGAPEGSGRTTSTPPPHAGRDSSAQGSPAGSAPEQPAASGDELVELTQAPYKTLRAFPADAYEPGASAEITFRPFGFGPSSFGPSVVVLVESAEQDSGSAGLPDLAGRNLVLLRSATTFTTGGVYRGRIALVPREDRLVFELSSATPVR